MAALAKAACQSEASVGQIFSSLLTVAGQGRERGVVIEHPHDQGHHQSVNEGWQLQHLLPCPSIKTRELKKKPLTLPVPPSPTRTSLKVGGACAAMMNCFYFRERKVGRQ